MSNSLPYRPCVGVVLQNQDGLIFTGERIDTPGAWQMPQGGIDQGETVAQAGLRELREETGVSSDLVTEIAASRDWITYELPDHLRGKLWKGRFRGQKQKWVLLAFSGTDADVEIVQPHQEFARWRWSTPKEVLRDIVPFKRDVYANVLSEFEEYF
ncbi:MAG: RNA pyrophosphohydrolase [Paracoccaceae bacterium]